MMKELGAVEETMLIPLYARAVTTRSGLFHDPCAVRIVEALDYNFRRLADRTHVLGSVFRTAMFDEMLGAFLRRCPRATIVEIGAGLNARFERVDNGMLQWIDVDLPNVMRLRRQFFRETRRRRMVTSSVLDPDWIEPVIRAGGPYFVIAEGVFGYLPADHVKRALTLIAEQLPTARVTFDTTANEGCEHGKPVWPWAAGEVSMGVRRSTRSGTVGTRLSTARVTRARRPDAVDPACAAVSVPIRARRKSRTGLEDSRFATESL